MIKIRSDLIKIIFEHAQKKYPEECCGILLGEQEDDCRTAQEVYIVNNAAGKDRQKDHFLISTDTMLHAEYMAAKKNYRIIGIYHSHTDCEAVPSDMDQRFAIPELSYPIISVKKRRIDHLHSWEKSSTGCDVFVPEIIRITN